ncbi:Noc2p-like protein [Encephalitozoon hellem]|uniref:Noc2p-like protein n=1 Tax=Encephalitozoon hellem TaxID=27973 RepID=A0ABY8CMQ1_ENCHE|nr:Noc2p-like protein [Encephalitozoon hellem]
MVQMDNERGLEESYLSKLYTSQPSTLAEDIKNYVLSPKDTGNEILYLERYISSKSPDLAKIIFISEVLGKCLRRHSEFRDYTKLLVALMETYKDYPHSIFCLRVIKSAVGSKFYVPLSFYILRILGNAISVKNLVASGRRIDYDMVVPDAERTKSEEHQMFVIEEAGSLLLQHMSTFSRNIGFPELASVVICELKKLRIGIYKEIVGKIIFEINEQKEYVLEKRNKLKLNGIDGKTISSFESSIERTIG